MSRAFPWVIAATLVLGATACTEKPQTAQASPKKTDGKPWQGAKDDYVAKGWTPGDQTSWESQIRTRMQSQNEYTRTSP